MKMKIIKIAGASLLAVALVPMAQAIPSITGTVTFDGTIQLGNSNGVPVSSVANATQVLAWYGNNGVGSPYVASSSLALSAASFAPVTFATPWAFGPQASLWSYVASDGDTFAFSLNTITSGPTVQGNPSVLSVTGLGTISEISGPVAYANTPGTWSFSTSDPAAGGVFSFQAASGTNVPDGGATMMLLGMALSGVALLRRKLTA